MWGNDATKSIEKEIKSIVGFLNMWSFEGWGCARMKPMLKNLVHSWIIDITFPSYYQNFCQFKVQPSWKVFSLQTNKKLIKCKMSFPSNVDVDLEDLVIIPYCGLENM
jgi:hypothetical protein